MRFFSVLYFFLLLFSQALAFSFPQIVQDALLGQWSHSPFQSVFSPVPSDFDFWRSLKDLGDKANTYKEKILEDATAEYTLVADKIHEFKEVMDYIVSKAEAMTTAILQHVDLQEFQKQLQVKLAPAFEQLKQEFSEPLSEDQTERYQQQKIRIARALDMIEDAFVSACGILEIPEVDVRTKFDDIKPHVNHGLLIVANLVNNHPLLFETLIFSAVILILPESIILRPIYTLFGFGPSGPVKGSFATFSQRCFFGAVVKKGSWFSMLQRAGMKTPEVSWITAVIRAIKCFLWGSC